MSDYVVMVKERAKVFLGGPPLVKMATGEDANDEELGGAEMHARSPGLADYMAADERDALRLGRRIVARLHWRKRGPGPSAAPREPRYDPEELLGIASADLKVPFPIREVIARLVDDSDFDEFKPLYGTNLVTGWARLYGHEIGILANEQGVLFSEEAQKAAQFIQLANQIDTPLLFLQNVTGYMVGKRYEQGGIIKHGSLMVNAVSNSAVPHLTLQVGGSYGAGNYGMSGRAFKPRFLFLWPNAKTAVMGPEQLAGHALDRGAPGGGRAAGKPFDEAADAKRRAAIEEQIERESLVEFTSGRLLDDGVLDPRDSRTALGLALSAVALERSRGGARVRRLPDVRRRCRSYSDREPGRDRAAHPAHLPRDGHRDGRGLLGARRERAVRARGRRGGGARRRDARRSRTCASTRSSPRRARRARTRSTPATASCPRTRRSRRRAARRGSLFVGPTPEAIAAMGSKLEAKRRMQAAGVPQLPSREARAASAKPAALAALAKELGLPLLVKASAGGGGRGMRVVRDAAAARRGGRVRRPRGALRVRRRHGLPRALPRRRAPRRGADLRRRARPRDPPLRARVLDPAPPPEDRRGVAEPGRLAARCATRSARPRSWRARRSATAAPAPSSSCSRRSGEFFFLEVNTRLQVEHPVTELVTGLDLVRLQLEVARGAALPAQADVPAQRGHAHRGAALRRGSRSATSRPRPACCTASPSTRRQGLRVDAGVEDGSEVSVYYDPMLAKVIAWARDARRGGREARCGARARAHPRPAHEPRPAGAASCATRSSSPAPTDTHFLERHPPATLGAPLVDAAGERLHALAAALARAGGAPRAARRVLAALPSGWRNVPSQDQEQVVRAARRARAACATASRATAFARASRTRRVAGLRLHAAAPRRASSSRPAACGGATRCTARASASSWTARSARASCARCRASPSREAELASGSLVAPMPGLVKQVLVAVGARVAKGDALLVLEAMKMEQVIRAPRAGRVSALSARRGPAGRGGRSCWP